MACDSCDCAIRFTFCGVEFSAADTNDDGIVDFTLEQKIVTYSGANPAPEDAVVAVDPENTASIPFLILAQPDGSDEFTHVAVCGTWYRLTGSTIVVNPPDPGEGERVTYQVGDWTYPAAYDASCGSLIIDGTERMTEECPATDKVVCPDSNLQTTYGGGGEAAPAAGWASLSWAAGGSGANGCSGTITEPSATGLRRAIRWNFAGGVGADEPSDSVATFGFEWLSGDGTLYAAVYDSSSDDMVPFSFSKPSGAVVAHQDSNRQLRVYGQDGSSGMLGEYFLTVDTTGRNLADLELILWQIGDTNSTEIMGNPSLEYEAAGTSGCFQWQSSASIAAYLNSKIPSGIAASFSVDGNGDVFADVETGVGALFGVLTSCDSPVQTETPVVTTN